MAVMCHVCNRLRRNPNVRACNEPCLKKYYKLSLEEQEKIDKLNYEDALEVERVAHG